MTFNSPLFLFLFIPSFFAVYYVADKKLRRVVALIGSFLFFSWGNAIYIPLMVGLILWNYAFGRKLGASAGEKSSQKILWAGIAGNLFVLLIFKTITSYEITWLPNNFQKSLVGVAFPLGLSYITFQTISYLADVFKGSIKTEYNLLNFSLYVMLFPKIVVGPITRYKKVSSALPMPDPSQNDVVNGIRRFIRGFAKKILIADMLAPLVDAAFKLGPESIHTETAWLALFAYALQIYYDFSGYTDMALGLGKMMGFEFEENFNFPYVSQSLGEFWRRWHISLSTWFRDYVFFPLERRRLKYFGQPINIFIVFLLTGLWHGVTLPFIVWGSLHGIFLVIENLFLGRLLKKTWQPIRYLYTFSTILFTWIFFRSHSLNFAWNYLLRLLGRLNTYVPPTFSQSTPLPFIEPSFTIAFIAGVIFSVPLVPWLGNQLNKFPTANSFMVIVRDAILLLAFVASIAFMATRGFAPGIYGGF